MAGGSCDVCATNEVSAVRCSSLGPVSWAYCTSCQQAGAEPSGMIQAALRMWQRRRWPSAEQAARRLLWILVTPTVADDAPARGSEVIATPDATVEPVATAIDAFTRQTRGELDSGQVLALVVAACDQWI